MLAVPRHKLLLYPRVMRIERDQAGFIGIISIIIVIMIIGYLVISRLAENDSVQDAKTTTTELIDEAKNSVDKANEASEKAGQLVE